MDEPLVLVSRLDELAVMTETDNLFEKAAVYSAVTAIENKFKSSKIKGELEIINELSAAIFYICASIDYEYTKNTKEKCLSKAKLKLEKLRSLINIRFY